MARFSSLSRKLPMKALVLLCALLLPSLAFAEDVAVLLPNVVKSYTVTTDGKGGAVIVPLAGLVRPGGSPTIPPMDPPPPSSPFAKEIQAQTAKVLTAGGTKTTGAGLSTVYSIVADKVSDGSIPVDQALGAIKAATNLVLNEMPDKDTWTPWRTAVGDALTKLQQEGALTTKAQYAAAFREIAGGLNAATGHSPASLRAPPANGILAGIDIAKIIELIKLIMELLKLFGG